MHTTTTILALAATLSSVSAHVALWDKGLFGLNWPNQVGDSTTNWNNNEPVNPLREADGFSIDQWFGHGLKAFPPGPGDFLELPAGGRYTGDVQCNRAGSRLRDPAITRPLPEYACDTEGPLHVMNKFGQPVDYSKFGGTALAIAYTSDVGSLQPNDMTVISVNHNSVWEREISYDIPAGLPPCPEGGCLCTWNWIHQASGSEGYGSEIYNNLYRCQVTGNTNSANVVQRGQVPQECGSNSANCIKGPKTPMYIYQAEGNNIARRQPPPIYQSNWGFEDGAQNDIFAAGSTPAPTTYIPDAYATGTNTRTTPLPSATALPTGWTSVGCMVDDPNSRALDGGSTQSSTNTVESCTASCAAKGFIFAGVEYGTECWCGNTLKSTAAPDSECNVRCGGDQWSWCGGGYRLNVYRAASAPTTASAVPTGTPTPIAASALPTGWSALGCHVDDGSNRALNRGSTSSNNLTIPDCIASCSAKGMPYAGVEYGQECWCGDSANLAPASDGCTSRCGGDPNTICGGGYRISIFQNDALAPRAPASSASPSATSSSARTTSTSPPTTSPSATPTSTTSSRSFSSSLSSAAPSASLPAGWQSLGCTVDSASKRVLTGSYSESNSQTPALCMARCQSLGFAYAGLQYGKQCYCGAGIDNASMVTSGCTATCAGDKSLFCGGNYRMNLYGLAAGSSSSSSSTVAPTATATGGGQIEYKTVTVTTTVTVNTCSSPTATLTRRDTKYEGRRYPVPRNMGRD